MRMSHIALVAALVGCSSEAARPQSGGEAVLAQASGKAAGAQSKSGNESTQWVSFRGPGGLGVSSDKTVPTTWGAKDNVAWRVDLPGAGTSSPILVGSRIYLTTYTGFNVPGQPAGSMDQLKLHLVCLNRADGKLLCKKDLTPKLPEQDRIREGHGYASSTLACDGERLYGFFGVTGAVAFDLEGNKLWQQSLGTQLNGWGSSNSPVLFDDLVIVNASIESGSLVGLDKKTGNEVWRARGIRESWNTPILAPAPGGKTELVVAIQGKVLGFDPKSGDQLWWSATDIGWYMVPGIVHDGTNVYCLGGRSGVAGLAVRLGGRGDVTRTHRLWTSNKGSNVTSPIVHEGHLYWMHEGLGIAYCADVKTGKLVYEERIPAAQQVYASPVLAGGNIYYITRTGRAFVVAAKPKFELVASNDFGERSMFNASPAVADGKLFIRSDKSLWCIGKN